MLGGEVSIKVFQLKMVAQFSMGAYFGDFYPKTNLANSSVAESLEANGNHSSLFASPQTNSLVSFQQHQFLLW
jgi:hypothetical protein